jgi:adenylosuccinate synthase
MSSVIVVGAQWGDEGKGKVVDFCTERADVAVRYAGGPNAGHTLVVGTDRVIVRLVPSGILRKSTQCVLGQGMVIDLLVLGTEIDQLERRGLNPLERLFVSERAHIILPHHILIDTLRESGRSDTQTIGTTKKGIGPAYEDKVARRGLRAWELRDLARCEARIEQTLAAWKPIIKAMGAEVPSAAATVAQLRPMAERIVPRLVDGSRMVDEAIRGGKNVLLEGAQGTLLDVDHGTYPFVTSSSAGAGGAISGAGIGPTRVDLVLGISKAYTTRVGEGPFPTELKDATGAKLREDGAEFGSVTGRPRRTGWVDVPALRHAARVNGIDAWALTKLDVLTGHSKVQVCVGYETRDGRTREFPIDRLDEPETRPVFETLDGWSESIADARRREDLPAAARRYLSFIEESTEVPLFLVSVGPRREQTIVLRDPFDVKTTRSTR